MRAFGINGFISNNGLKMIVKRLLFALVYSIIIACIDETCSAEDPCPTNSNCSNNDYCVCQNGFIGNCNIPAQQVGASQINANLVNGQTSLFYTVPSQFGKYIEFIYTICQNNSQLAITLTLWGESGENSQYTSSNALTAPLQTTIGSGCSDITTPYVSFGTQPNGQPEMLILGVADNSLFPVSITISVNQRVVEGFLIYYYVLIALGSFIILFLIIGAAIFIIRRRRLRRMAALASVGRPLEAPDVNDISYFESEMPVSKASMLGNDRSVCPICLMQIERNDLIRRTPCMHTFHSNCIDSWCLKTLNCPVCRADLSREVIGQKKDEPVQPQYHPMAEEVEVEEQVVEKLQERPGVEETLVDDKYAIRESML